MIQEKLEKKDINDLLKDVMFITLFAMIFFLFVGKFGGYISDFITKKSCTAIDETYVSGKNPGDGMCVKTSNNTNYKK